MSQNEKLLDNQLAESIRKADRAAFKTLYYRYMPSLRRFISSRLSRQEPVDDLVQEVFLRLWERRNNINPTVSIKAYLFQTGYHLLIDHYRKFSRRKTEPVTFTAEQMADSVHPELQSQVHMAIQNLPEPLAVVFMLSRYDGFTYAEIAGICKVSVKTVEKRMSLALKQLRQELLD